MLQDVARTAINEDKETTIEDQKITIEDQKATIEEGMYRAHL